MTLSKALFAPSSGTLLTAGTTLSANQIRALDDAGLKSVIVEDDRLQVSNIATFLVRDGIYNRAVRLVYEVYTRVRLHGELDITNIVRAAYELVDDVLTHPEEEQLMACQAHRSMNDYLYDHVVQVAIMAVAVGRQRSYKLKQLQELAMAALLMDIGIMVIDREVAEATTRFSREDQDEMKKHCQLGYDLLSQNTHIPEAVARAVLQHSERHNGSGYPHGLKENDIGEYARILAVCDTYDALITDKAYRRRFLPRQALGILIAGMNQTFEEQSVHAFTQLVAPYPVGSILELNTRDTAVVVSVPYESKNRPIIRLLLDRRRYIIDGVMEMDLTEINNISIERMIEDLSVPVLWKSRVY